MIPAKISHANQWPRRLARFPGFPITVEGKVDEGFGRSTAKWREDASLGKRERLARLCKRLRRAPARVDHISYQLLHRTAAALIEAERFNSNTAVTLIHSFSGDLVGFKDYQAFISLFGKWSKPNTVTNVGRRNGVQLYTS